MIGYSDDRKPSLPEVVDLYRSVEWSSAEKPDALHKGLVASHQQALLADGRAIDFYKKLGFRRAGATEPLWIFDGREHD